MDQWDVILLALAGFAAVTMLVRLMRRRREQLLRQLQREAAQAKKRRSTRPDQQKPADRNAA